MIGEAEILDQFTQTVPGFVHEQLVPNEALVAEYGIESIYRDVRLFRIYESTVMRAPHKFNSW